jgi:GT2 family glycosyltransferase
VAGVSLYVPCYNVERFIGPCLEAALAQSVPFDEILVIDDGCRDRTVEIAARYPVRIVRHERNRGLAAGRNTGLREARNELVAALDADCVADRRWLATLLPEMADAGVVGVGGRLVESVQESLADRWRLAHMSQHWGDQRLAPPPCLYGNNTLVRRAAVLATGGYDERYRTNGEDIEMSRLLRLAGGRLVYRPDAVVNHLRQDSLRSILDTYWRYRSFGLNLHTERLTLLNVARHVGYSMTLRDVRKVLWPDLLHGEWRLLGIDVLLPFYMLRRYLGLLSEQLRANPRSAA